MACTLSDSPILRETVEPGSAEPLINCEPMRSMLVPWGLVVSMLTDNTGPVALMLPLASPKR